MNRLEKLIVLTMFVGQAVFVPVAMWTLTQPGLRENMGTWSRPIGFFLALVSLVAVVLLYRDLANRVAAGQVKPGWVVALFLSGGIALIPYTFLHAFKPRKTDARV